MFLKVSRVFFAYPLFFSVKNKIISFDNVWRSIIRLAEAALFFDSLIANNIVFANKETAPISILVVILFFRFFSFFFILLFGSSLLRMFYFGKFLLSNITLVTLNTDQIIFDLLITQSIRPCFLYSYQCCIWELNFATVY